MKTLWLKVTRDEYELPVAVADTITELAEMCGVMRGTIASQMSRVNNPNSPRKKTVYRKVEIDDGEDTEWLCIPDEARQKRNKDRG